MVRAQSAAAAAAVVVFTPFVGAQVMFVDTSAGAGFEVYSMARGMASGVAAADFDGDGDIDLFVPTSTGTPDQLYRNLGDGTFDEIAAGVGLASNENHRGALWVDVDSDGDLDLFIVGDHHLLAATGVITSSLRLHRQDAGAFTDITADAGMLGLLYPPATSFPKHVGGMAAGDLNRDGRPDLIVTFWDTTFGGAAIHVYRNDGDGAFTDISVSSGMNPDGASHWQPIVHDFNGDGWQDVFVAHDFDPNRLWLNQKNGFFAEVAGAAGVANAWNDMGVALGDYDNDGDFDLFVTNIQADPGSGGSWEARHNVFYRNDSLGPAIAFSEVSHATDTFDGDWGWGVTFADVDCDGWLDIAQTNGFETEPEYIDDPTRLFLSLGAGPGGEIVFLEDGAGCGVADTDVASGLIAADIDRDGDLDLIQTTRLLQLGPLGLRLYENQTLPPAGALGASYLVVRPRMHGRNTHALGATVRVRTGTEWRSRLITAGTSILCQEPGEAHFGLGLALTADEVVIGWPDGRETNLLGVAANQVLDVALCVGDLDGESGTNVLDFALWLTRFGLTGQDPFSLGDLDGDGNITVLDFAEWLLDFNCE